MSHLSRMQWQHLPKLISIAGFHQGLIFHGLGSKGNGLYHNMCSNLEKNVVLPIKYCDKCVSLRCYSTKTSRFTLKNETYSAYMKSLEQECTEMNDAQTMGKKLPKDQSYRLVVLRRVIAVYEELKAKYEELEELDKMLNDEEMKDLVGDDREICMNNIQELEEQLVDIVCPEEHIDECDIILEIESGAGGQEAMLFAEEVFNMYQNFAHNKGWQFSLTQNADTDIGIRKASAAISGQAVFGEMKFEGGVHRVQRIPKTESKGRIHTSTISVAILPQPSEIDIVLDPKDLQITSFRSSAPGGQHVNTTDSAVRIKHIPTGMVAESQTTRSQAQNKQNALMLLRTRMYEKQMKEQTSKITSQRKLQVGNKNRSEKIRTYNFPQDRITDHRLGHNFNNMTEFMMGETGLQNMINELQKMAKLENLHAILDELEDSGKKTKRTKK